MKASQTGEKEIFLRESSIYRIKAKMRFRGGICVKNRLMYMLGVFIPSVSMIALVSMIVWLAYDFGFHDPSDVNIPSAVLRAAVIPVCIILIRIFDPIRREYRQRIQTDQYGLRKNSFKDMSKKERRAMELQHMARDEQILSTAEWMSMVKNGSKNPDADLSDLVGIVPVKEKVLEMKAQMVYGGRGARRPPNVCLLGNPGTGKTTVAGILTGFLAKYGFIKENRYVVVNGTSFGSSPDPVRRTNLILAKSKGKLLFIDEAYSLARSAYGQQILTIILDDMEKNRDGMALVLAGYKKAEEKIEGFVNGYFDQLLMNPFIACFLLREMYRSSDCFQMIMDNLSLNQYFYKVFEAYKEQVAKGELKDVPVYAIILNMVGGILSPFIFQPIIEKALSENLDKEICPTEDFRTLVDMWRPYAIQNMKNLLLP